MVALEGKKSEHQHRHHGNQINSRVQTAANEAKNWSTKKIKLRYLKDNVSKVRRF